tara:strand:- start:397 stop:897 length:501 start_codon:yes stop_codon:yes gene_type:complete
MRFLYPLFLVFIAVFASIVFSLEKFHVPSDGLNHEMMTFEKAVKGGEGGLINSRFSRRVVFLTRDNGDDFRFYSNGYAVNFARKYLEQGDYVKVTWFNPCHEILDFYPGECAEVIAINDVDKELVERFYLEDRKKSFVFYSLIVFVSVFVFLLGMIVKEKDSNDVR